MRLSRLMIKNFRNFKQLDVPLAGNMIVVGENRVGKSNLIHALRLIFDPSLPDSARQLSISDFWDGHETLDQTSKIKISVDIEEFDTNMNILAILTDCRVKSCHKTARLTYVFKPRDGLGHVPSANEDFEFFCYGGSNPSNRFGHDVRHRITLDVLHALRDAEGDLNTWYRSPLRPLLEEALNSVDSNKLEKIGEKIYKATCDFTKLPEVTSLEQTIINSFQEMSGPKQDIKPKLGLLATDSTRLLRQIKLLIDDGKRGVPDASLGSANLIFLALKTLQLKNLIAKKQRDYSLLAIEEPEAHLHPHLQRLVYGDLFKKPLKGDSDQPTPSFSTILTTHSPHIASIAPVNSILLLRETQDSGSVGHSTAVIDLTDSEIDDLSRYLDVTRAEILFARGVILVEGDAEKFLIPKFALEMGIDFDKYGISVCSVSGTYFIPYAKFLASLGIPFAIVTDWDDGAAKNRAINLVEIINNASENGNAEDMKEIKRLAMRGSQAHFKSKTAEFGIYTNNDTLEIDLMRGDFRWQICETLREGDFGHERKKLIEKYAKEYRVKDKKEFLDMVKKIGKGRFAQRLATRVQGISVPEYIAGAIQHVVDRV